VGQGGFPARRGMCVEIHSTTWVSSVFEHLSLSGGLFLAATCRECVGRALRKCVERFSRIL